MLNGPEDLLLKGLTLQQVGLAIGRSWLVSIGLLECPPNMVVVGFLQSS